jgi:hypothetical protein
MPDSISPDQNPENLDPQKTHEVVNQSGGAGINAHDVQVNGDVVGRDKIEHANGSIIHANIVIVNDGRPLEASAELAYPLSKSDPKFALENPTGAVRPDSPFYIERPSDHLLRQQVLGNGTITTICAGPQTGKTSLLMQGIQVARQQGLPVVYLDFQLLESKRYRRLDSLLNYMATEVCYQLSLDPKAVEKVWKSPLSPSKKFSQLLEEQVLSQTSVPLLLAIDEVDKLLDSTYKNDFFGFIRSWNSHATYRSIWQKLNIVLAVSTEPFLLIDNPQQSPFNVGLVLDLEDFDRTRVADLNQRHGSPVAEVDLPAAMDLLGGHPYLVRQALYTLVTSQMVWSNLAQIATDEQGPFGRHLRYYSAEIVKHPALVKTLRQIIAQGHSADEKTLYRLNAIGLIKRAGGSYVCRCGLYEAYFKEKLR